MPAPAPQATLSDAVPGLEEFMDGMTLEELRAQQEKLYWETQGLVALVFPSFSRKHAQEGAGQ